MKLVNLIRSGEYFTEEPVVMDQRCLEYSDVKVFDNLDKIQE